MTLSDVVTLISSMFKLILTYIRLMSTSLNAMLKYNLGMLSWHQHIRFNGWHKIIPWVEDNLLQKLQKFELYIQNHILIFEFGDSLFLVIHKILINYIFLHQLGVKLKWKNSLFVYFFQYGLSHKQSCIEALQIHCLHLYYTGFVLKPREIIQHL